MIILCDNLEQIEVVIWKPRKRQEPGVCITELSGSEGPIFDKINGTHSSAYT